MRRWILVVLGVFVALIATGLTIVAMHWPFTQANVTAGLQQKFGSHVEIKSFRSNYFPPMCVAEGVTFRRNTQADVTPIATVARLTIEGSYPGFFADAEAHLARDRRGAARVCFGGQRKGGAEAPAAQGGDNTKIEIGDITADNSVVEFSSGEAGAKPPRFEIHKLTMNDVSEGQPMAFHAELTQSAAAGRDSRRRGIRSAGHEQA